LSALQVAIVDAGPLYAALDTDDANHEAALSVLNAEGLIHVVPVMVLAEVLYLCGTRLGAAAEAAFLESAGELDVRGPALEDWPRIGELVRQYADFPLGGVDASVVALAERLGTDVVITFDRRHFGAIKPRHAPAFTLLPASA
jgi:predicted nucleic acid-binding protein